MKLGLRAICHAPLGIALLFPAAAVAQAAEDGSPATPSAAEIIVTATKQNTTLGRVAAAVSAITAADIGPGGVQNIGDLQVVVPNVSIGDQFGVNRTFIRGVGLNNFDVGGEGAVAFLQNGAILARPAQQLSGFFDLGQIEVLRGPQSILYGRGATAGAINLVTAMPTEKLDGYLRATYGNYDSKVIEAAVGGPLSGDKLLVRLAGKYEKRDGYGVNLFTGKPVDDRDAYSLRGTIVAKLAYNFKATIVGDHFHEDDNNYAFHYFGPSVIPEAAVFHNLIGGKSIFDYYAARNQKPNLRNIYSDEEAINKRKGYGITGTLDWDLGATTVKSITAYRTFDRFQRDDLDVSDVNLAGQNNYVEKSRAFSQEVTVNYQGNGFSLLGGAMYFHEKLTGQVLVPTVNLGVLFGLPANTFDNGAYEQNGTVKIDAVGVYLQGAVDISPTLKLTAGARYNYEHRNGVGYFRFDALGVNIPTDKAKGWSSVTPKVLLEFKPSDTSLLYASVTKGFKSGVINIGSTDAAINPETVWSYEAGFKQKLADNRLLLSGAVFYYDYKDLQVSFVNANSIVQTINAATARNYGGELELEGRVTRNFRINLSASYLNAQFTKFCNAYYGAGFPARPGISYAPCPTDPGLVDLSGKRLPNAPRFTFGGGFNWDIPLGNDSRLAVNGDIKWQSKVYFTEFNNRDAEQGAYAMANAGLTWHSPNDRYSIGAWVKNLTNKFVISNNIITAATFAYVRVGSVMPPRTYGVTAAFNF
ncbi:TonB-dependent receptor [Novosphingobium sp. EMRT-2]|uniref:TonB-dependent receptor n=1 Tax=Novosphingobium sp. EMRT-2 TaxID=2571749 RepID=UPI0010BDB5AE|nr:TonB-dependent receptor [Novosphingobium sp. EMRT-2]QCI95853.1 TonB-dependent receptor [Novosphingobium sp. EMRT-2]